jgi:hypothetical protein
VKNRDRVLLPGFPSLPGRPTSLPVDHLCFLSGQARIKWVFWEFSLTRS